MNTQTLAADALVAVGMISAAIASHWGGIPPTALVTILTGGITYGIGRAVPTGSSSGSTPPGV